MERGGHYPGDAGRLVDAAGLVRGCAMNAPPFVQGILAGFVGGMILVFIKVFRNEGLEGVKELGSLLIGCILAAVVVIVIMKTYFADSPVALALDTLADGINDILIHYGVIEACEVGRC